MQIGIKLEKIGKQIYWEVLCSPVSSLFLCPICSLFLIPIFLFFPKINIFNFYRNRRKLCIWSSQLRSGSAHCDLEFAVEVRKCERDLQFTVGGRRKEKGWRRRRKEEGRRKEEVTLIKSRDPVFLMFSMCVYFPVVSYIYIFIYIYIYVLLFYHVLAVFFNPCLFKCVYFIVLKTIRNLLLFWMLEYIYIYIYI